MDFFNVVNTIIAYIQDNLLIAAIAALLLAVVAYRYTKFFLIVFFIALFAIGVFYMISALSDTGVAHKRKMLLERTLPVQNPGDFPISLLFL